MSFFKSIFKNYPYLTLFSLFLFLFFLIFNVFSWTIPQDNPPNSNLPAPLNVSSEEQTKEGNLNINGLLRLGRFTSHPTGTNGALYYNTTDNKFYGYSNNSWQELGSGAGGGLWALSNNNIYNTNSGNVGIGTTDPTAKLYVRTTDLTTVPFQVDTLVGFDSNLMPGWSYRKSIRIYNSGSSLTDYQVWVTLDTASLISAGKMRSDCGDIRFTDSDGTTSLSYWLESGCNSASTKIWVKIPSIPANSTKTIYVYYGNPSATSAMNGDNVFILFDDFEDGVINTTKWKVTGVVMESGGQISIGSTANQYDKLESVNSYGPSVVLEMKGNIATTEAGYHIYGFGGGPRFIVHWETDPAIEAQMNEASSTNAPDVGYNAPSNQKWKIVWKADGYADFYVNDVLKVSRTTNPQTSAQTLLFQEYEANRYHTIEYLFIRKYTSPEPTTSVGIEESTPQQQTVFYIQNQTGNVGIGTTDPTYKLHVNGSFAATTKNFEINHPTKPGKKLVHACIEGPEVAVFYRGEGKLIKGKAIIELPDYFEALTRKEGRTIQITAKGTKPYLLSASEVKDGKFMVYGNEPDGEFYWEVKAVRADVEPLQVEK